MAELKMNLADTELQRCVNLVADNNSTWNNIRHDAWLSFQSELTPIFDPILAEYPWDFPKNAVLPAAKVVLRSSRKLLHSLLIRRLADAVAIAQAIRASARPSSKTADAVLSRDCTVSRWLLSLKLRELDCFRINSVDLGRSLTALEIDQNDNAYSEVASATKLLQDMMDTEVRQPRQTAARPKTIKIDQDPLELIGEIYAAGIRICRADTGALIRQVKLERRFLLLLVQGWYETSQLPDYGNTKVDIDSNPCIPLVLQSKPLCAKLGRVASRSNIHMLRRRILFKDDEPLLMIGPYRNTAIPFRLYCPSGENFEVTATKLFNAIGLTYVRPR